MGDHDLYALLADAAAQLGDEEALGRYAPLAEESAARFDHTLYQAIASRAWGILYRLKGDYGSSEARLNRALILFQKLEARWQTGRTFYELGRLAWEQGGTAGSGHHYAQALAAFEALGAEPDAERVRAALASRWQ